MLKSLEKFNSCDHEGHTPSLCPHLGVESLTAEQTMALDLDARLRRVEAMLGDIFELLKETCDKVDDVQNDIDAAMLGEEFEQDGASVEGDEVTEGV